MFVSDICRHHHHATFAGTMKHNTHELSSHTPQVSVVITCYNQAAFIGEAIESAFNQTFALAEVIVIDDGSPDDTEKVVNGFGARVRYIKQANAGVVAARTRGINESKGEFLVLLDGDDRLLPTGLEREVEVLANNPDFAFVSGQCRLIEANGDVRSTPRQKPLSSNIYAALLRDNYIWMPAQVMFRRQKLIDAGGLDPHADHASDYELYLRLARLYSACALKENVADWRLHSGNTHHKLAMMMNSSFRVYRSQKQFIGSDPELKQAYHEGLLRWQDFYGEQVLRQLREELRRSYDLRLIVRNAVALTRHAPLLMAKHLMRKTYCVVFRIKSDLVVEKQ